MARRPLLRAAAVTALACAGLLGLSACTASSPILTMKSYAASDGTRVQFDKDLRAENLLVLADSTGANAKLYGAFVNNSDEPATFTVQLDGMAELSATVAPNSVTNLPDDVEAMGSASAKPGSMLDGTVATGQTGSKVVHVPVLDGTVAPYNEVTGN